MKQLRMSSTDHVALLSGVLFLAGMIVLKMLGL